MEPIYVIAICIGGLFLVLFSIYLLLLNKRNKEKERFSFELDKAYAPNNLKKMDYDLSYYDDETARRILNEKITEEEQVTIEDLIAPFGTTNEEVGEEDEEELIGRYKP